MIQSPDNKAHKKRVSKACDCCRKSKTKCDGMRPCTRCLQDNKICTYMSNKKKVDKMYPSSYVDLLETRVSILIQSLTKLLEKSKNQQELEILLKDPIVYNENGEFDINKVICQLLSSEKLQNLSQSNHNYSIDEITNVTSTNSNSQSPISPSINGTPITHQISLPKRHSESSHIHKLPHTNKHHSLRSPSLDFTSSSSNTLDSLLYNDSSISSTNITTTSSLQDLNNSDDTHSTNSSLMSPVYSINELESNSQIPLDRGFQLDNWTGVKQEYGFNWPEGFEFNPVTTNFDI